MGLAIKIEPGKYDMPFVDRDRTLHWILVQRRPGSKKSPWDAVYTHEDGRREHLAQGASLHDLEQHFGALMGDVDLKDILRPV